MLRAQLRSLWCAVFRRSLIEEEMASELQFHVEKRAADLMSRNGLPPSDAVRRARLEFGGIERYKETCRQARGAAWCDEIVRNLVDALRSMRNNPGFTAVAVMSLAIGIGANLAVFSVLHRLVLMKLPVHDPDRLYQVTVVRTDRTAYRLPFPQFEVMRANFDVFQPLFGWGNFPFDVAAGAWADTVPVMGVTGNYFEALAIEPALGRLLTSADEQDRASEIAVISHRLWRTAFAGSESAVGQTVKVAVPWRPGLDFSYIVVGVAPPEFVGTEPSAPPAVYLPLHAFDKISPSALTGAGNMWFHIMGRLPEHVQVSAVEALLNQRWRHLDEPNRSRFTRNTTNTIRLVDGSRGYSETRIDFSTPVIVLMALVATVFLVACANIATLMFVRGAGRTREMTIRAALGAGRARLIRQWMTECLLVSVIGGAAGLMAASWITDLLLYFVSEADRPWLRFQRGGVVLSVSIILTLTASLLAGLLPALRATAVRPDPALGARAATTPDRRGQLAQAVLAAQLAASLVLVFGGVIFARTLWNLDGASPGFDRRTIVYARTVFSSAVPVDRRGALVSVVLEHLERSPLVAAVSDGTVPLEFGRSRFGYVTRAENHVLQPDEDNSAFINFASPGYFEALRIPVIYGREFERRDRASAGQPVKGIIVNESFARHYFGTRNPVGAKIVWNPDRVLEIVGVFQDIKSSTLRDERKDEVYFPTPLDGWGSIIARAKPSVPPSLLEAEIRRVAATVTKELTLQTTPLEDLVQRSLGRDRLVARLSAAFGALGVLLAAIGLYAAISHTVASRTREIGIRMAVGAKTSDVVWMVLQQGLIVVGIGSAIGIPAAVGGAQLVNSLLYEVSPLDVPTLAASTLVLALIGVLAGYPPARRAARLDPTVALRCE